MNKWKRIERGNDAPNYELIEPMKHIQWVILDYVKHGIPSGGKKWQPMYQIKWKRVEEEGVRRFVYKTTGKAKLFTVSGRKQKAYFNFGHLKKYTG